MLSTMNLYLELHPISEELNHYAQQGDIIEGENYNLLGFKDDLPVLRSSEPAANEIMKNVSNKTTKMKMAHESYEEYINLNGQMLKIVPQSEIPEEVRRRTMLLKHQMINIGSLRNPLKVRVISGAMQIGENTKPVKPQNIDKLPLSTQDKSHSTQGTKKFKVISTKVLKPTSGDNDIHNNTSSLKVFSVNPKIVPVNSKQLGTCIDPYLTPEYSLNAGIIPREKLLSKRNLEILNQVKMQALNLSTKQHKHVNVDNLRLVISAEAGTQTEKKQFSDQVVQTEIQRNCQEELTDLFDTDFINFFDCDSNDSPIINNVNIGCGPTMGKTLNIDGNKGSSLMTLCMSGKNMSSVSDNPVIDDRLSKKLLFFTDLKECLTPNINGNLPIHEGVIKNDLGLVKRMCIALKVRRAGVNLENHNCCNPLQLAVINDCNVDIVQSLLDSGADITEVDGEGNNILHLTVKFERRDILNVILHHRVLKENFDCIDSFNFDGLTPLMICCMSSWIDGATLLLESSANVNLRDQTSGRTALFHAAEALSEDIVRLLLEYKADPKIKNFFGTSPHDAMYELDDMPEPIKHLIFGKTKKRSIEAEMNPSKTAKAAKTMKTFSRLQKVDRKDGSVICVPSPLSYKVPNEVK